MNNKMFLYLSWLVVGLTQSFAFSGNVQAGSAPLMPVRVSRTFFESPVIGSLQVTSASGESVQFDGGTSWAEEPTSLPAPAPDENTGPVLADYRDHTGCASLNDPGSVQLCFKVMPDVSNLGVNAREMKLQGIEDVLPPECAGATSALHFAGATRQGNESFTVKYVADDPSCGAMVLLTLKQEHAQLT